MSISREQAIAFLNTSHAIQDAFFAELTTHRRALVIAMQRYPLEIEFKGLRFVFNDDTDIDTLLALSRIV